MQYFLQGRQISLGGLRPDHLGPDSPYYGWLDDLSLDLFGERSDFPNNPRRMESYYAGACANDGLLLLGIFENETGRHVGNITLQQIDWVHRRGFIGYLIGDKAATGKGYASQACRMIMYHGFNKLNLDRIWTTVALDHAASMRVAAKAGFVREGVLRGHQLRAGTRRDMGVFGCLRGEWMASHGAAALELFEQSPV